MSGEVVTPPPPALLPAYEDRLAASCRLAPRDCASIAAENRALRRIFADAIDHMEDS